MIWLFQSTHPRRVWPVASILSALCFNVSIHTPTKGVTSIIYDYLLVCWFQSTHPRRVWLNTNNYKHKSLGFNPHTHEGCDLLLILFFIAVFVSIHTPTKGVTSCSRLRFRHNSVSIHTPTKGVTHLLLAGSQCLECFNPHTHEGCDAPCLPEMPSLVLFQSTHPRRVWHAGEFVANHNAVFQSTHPRRVWLRLRFTSVATKQFQSTHPRRVWRGARA